MKRCTFNTFRGILLPLALAVVSANTLAVCEIYRGPYSRQSETCWNPDHGIAEYDNYSLVEISRSSQELIRWWLEENDPEMVAEFANIEHIFDNKATIESVGYMLSRQGVAQGDCRLFHIQVESATSFSSDHALTRVGSSQRCRHAMRRLARAVQMISNPRRPTVATDIGFGNILQSSHLVVEIADGYKVPKQQSLGLSHFDTIHGTDDEVAEGNENTLNREGLAAIEMGYLDYPISMRVVGPGDTLSSIAKESSGDANSWTSIYALNVATLRDPNLIEQGSQLFLPAKVTGWKSVDLTQFSNLQEAAETIYGSGEYSGLLQYLCDDANLLERYACYLPEFSDVEGFQRLTVNPDSDD